MRDYMDYFEKLSLFHTHLTSGRMMNYWMFALIGIGCIFIVFVGVSIYILWSVKDLPCILHN